MNRSTTKNVERKCQCCQKPFMARLADVKRGWAKFCSKSCKAKKQEQRTGQCRAYLGRMNSVYWGKSRSMFEHSADDDLHPFCDEAIQP